MPILGKLGTLLVLLAVSMVSTNAFSGAEASDGSCCCGEACNCEDCTCECEDSCEGCDECGCECECCTSS